MFSIGRMVLFVEFEAIARIVNIQAPLRPPPGRLMHVHILAR